MSSFEHEILRGQGKQQKQPQQLQPPPPDDGSAQQQPAATLPYGLETIKPGAVRMMTNDKLSKFSLGQTKKTPFQRRKEELEAKRKEQEAAAQRELEKFQEEFDSEDKPK